jgi:hypothetical protein
MPGEITHLAFAERYLRQNPGPDFKEFVLGSVFPDIRYIAKTERDLTHKKFRPDFKISGLDDFKSGWKLHIYLDDKWNEIVKSSAFYGQHKHDRRIAAVAAKVIEDWLDYKKISQKGNFLKALRNPGIVKVSGVPQDTIKFHYSIIQEYLETKNVRFFLKYIFDKETVNKILRKIEEIKKDKKAVDFLGKILEKVLP